MQQIQKIDQLDRRQLLQQQKIYDNVYHSLSVERLQI